VSGGIMGRQKATLKCHGDVFANSATLNMKFVEEDINIWGHRIFFSLLEFDVFHM
jgi:hypothetical protein